MIDSAVLENYAPVIVPLTFTYGLRGIIQNVPIGGIEIVGIAFMIISLLIYYDRVAEKDKEIFAIGLGLLFVSYIGIRMIRPLWLLLTMAGGLVMIGKGVLKDIDFSKESQRIYISLILLFSGFIFTLVENNSFPPYPIALLLNALGITFLTLSTMELSKV